MSFREKSAWITLVTLLFTTLLWALHFPWAGPFTLAPQPNPFLFHTLVLATISFVVIEVVAHVIVAVLAPREASAPADERERLIGLKSTRLGAYVYAFMSLSAIVSIHHGANAIGLACLLLFSFVTALVVSYTARIVYYRRGVR